MQKFRGEMAFNVHVWRMCIQNTMSSVSRTGWKMSRVTKIVEGCRLYPAEELKLFSQTMTFVLIKDSQIFISFQRVPRCSDAYQ